MNPQAIRLVLASWSLSFFALQPASARTHASATRAGAPRPVASSMQALSPSSVSPLSPSAPAPTSLPKPAAPSPQAAPPGPETTEKKRPLRLIIAGAPGSGKGTQSKKLAAERGLVHVSVGDLLRKYVEATKDAVVAGQIERGELADFALVLRLIQERLSQDDVAARGFILDGSPRQILEALELDKLLQRDLAVDAIIRLEVPEEELLRRILARGRQDDTKEIFRDRMRIYRAQTMPALELLEKRFAAVTTDASGPDPEAGYARLRAALEEFLGGRP